MTTPKLSPTLAPEAASGLAPALSPVGNAALVAAFEAAALAYPSVPSGGRYATGRTKRDDALEAVPVLAAALAPGASGAAIVAGLERARFVAFRLKFASRTSGRAAALTAAFRDLSAAVSDRARLSGVTSALFAAEARDGARYFLGTEAGSGAGDLDTDRAALLADPAAFAARFGRLARAYARAGDGRPGSIFRLSPYARTPEVLAAARALLDT